jgi:hypothetical protein
MWGERLRLWFPDREFFMRADGQVRFIKLSAKLQIRVASGVVGIASLWLVALAVMAWGQYRAEADLASLPRKRRGSRPPASGSRTMAAISTRLSMT